jgi:hypothetical protein
MQIVSKEVIGRPDDLTKAVYITCLAQDQSYVESEILPPLDEYGIAYLLTVKTAAACEEYSYYENTEIKISRCSCGIFVFSPAYQEAEDICRQCYFYEIGLFEGTKLDIYPFLISPKSPQMQNFLLDKPISLIQASYDISKIIEEIRKYDNMQEPFFKNNPALNKVVSKRVMYVKFVVLLNISVSTLKNIWNSEEWDKSSFKSAEFDSKEMIDLLFSEINTGITLLSFGSEKIYDNQSFAPYFDETEKIFYDYPAKFDKASKPKALEDDVSDEKNIATTVKMEFYIPVNMLLGASFKPFIAINKRGQWKHSHIREILLSDLGAGYDSEYIKIYPTKSGYRLYFLLPMTERCISEISGEALQTYGKKCNYVFPK